MNVTIDGKEASGSGTVLDVARSIGIEIPALCRDDRTCAGGHCRACMVEISGRLLPACTTHVAPGMTIRTDSRRVREYRRDLGELMLAESRPGGIAAQFLKEWGADGTRYRPAPKKSPPKKDDSHAYLRIDLEKCIVCRRCVAACDEVQGQFVYSVVGRGADSRIDWGESAFAATDCVSCGSCVAACPSDAISDIDRIGAERSGRTIRTTCSYCGTGCSLDVHLASGKVSYIEGAEASVNDGRLCVKGRYAHTFARSPDRLTTPLIKRKGKFERATWDEALTYVAEEMARLDGAFAGLSSSRCTNEENYLFQKLMRAGLGTNDVDCCARVCHAPSAAGMREVFGTGAATNELADIERADLFFVSGSNTTESHPVIGARLKTAVLRGAKLIVVDPRRTEIASIADVHLAPRPGTNVLLLNALASVLVEEGLFDRSFINTRTDGFHEYAQHLRRFSPESTESATLCPAELVRRAARLYAEATAPMQMHGLGMTEHYQGTEGVMLLCNLAMLVGAVGREGVGVNPLRGQNNVQGAADMGCQPDLLTGYLPVADAAVRKKFEEIWRVAPPDEVGRRLPEIYDAIDGGRVRGMFILGENVVTTDPDAKRVIRTLSRLEFLVVEEIFMSETAELAHVVLPGACFLEKDGTFTNCERRIQRVRAAVPAPGEARADWEILAELLRRLHVPGAYRSAEEVWNEVRKVAPAFSAASYAEMDADGVQWPADANRPHGTPILHIDEFQKGRAVFKKVDYEPSPALARAEGPLCLITGRVLEHYNSGSMTRRGRNVILAPDDRLQIHPFDAAARGIKSGDRVRIVGKGGEAAATAEVTDAVKKGELFVSFHFAESHTNDLTSDIVDRIADCPEYKVTFVDVVPVS